MMPARGFGWLGALLAFFAGAWLVLGPSFYPTFSSGSIQPYGTELMRAVRWTGHFYGVGGLLLYFSGVADGLLKRRPLVEETPAPAAPATTQRTVVEE